MDAGTLRRSHRAARRGVLPRMTLLCLAQLLLALFCWKRERSRHRRISARDGSEEGPASV